MPATSYKIADNLYLIDQPIVKPRIARPVIENTNHVLVFDCSGSMYGVLPAIRAQIKNKIVSLAKPGDTVTIIWFSGRNDYDVLIEGHPLDKASDFTKFNQAVDRWLQPRGLTGFKGPLEKVLKTVENLSKNGNPFSMFFLTDGYDNQFREHEILNVCDQVGVHVQSSTLVEFGFYCNRPLLTKMAERIGGTLIFSESFLDYEPTFEAAIQRRPMGSKKINVLVEAASAVGGFVWSFDGNPTVYRIDNGEVTISEGVDRIVYLSEAPVGKALKFTKTCPVVSDAYVGMAVYAQRMNADIVFRFLKATGDVRFIEQFASCFGKQSYSTFQRDTLEAANDRAQRLTKGYDPDMVPRDDAFTVLDVLAHMGMDEGNLFYPKHPEFGYQRIGRATEQSDSRLTEAEQSEISSMLVNARSKDDHAKIQARMQEMIALKPTALKFTDSVENPGVPVMSLTTHESRPNISVLVRIEGTVDLAPLLSDVDTAKLFKDKNVPTNYPTYIWRNYTIIADGIVNTKKLPVSLTPATYAEFCVQGLLDKSQPYVPGQVYLIDLSHLPVINRKMVTSATAKKLFETEFDSERMKAGNKVLNDALKALGGGINSTGIEGKYGADVAAKMALNGITDRGFSPKVVQKEAVDVYLGKELKSSIKGLSSLPPVAKVREALAKKSFDQLTISQKLIAEWLPVTDELAARMKLPEGDENRLTEKECREILDRELRKNRERSRELDRVLNEIKFGIVVGQVWFSDFGSLDENTMSLNSPMGNLDCKVELVETEFKR